MCEGRREIRINSKTNICIQRNSLSRGWFLFLFSDGPLVGVPFIDDYISTTEQVSHGLVHLDAGLNLTRKNAVRSENAPLLLGLGRYLSVIDSKIYPRYS